MRCFADLAKYGADKVLEREYGPYIVAPEQGYDFSVMIDLDNLPADQEERANLVRRLSLLKRNAMAAPFETAFAEYEALHEEASKYTSESAPQGVREGGAVRAIHYRDEEAIYIKASHDRVTVIFSTVFREETDRVFGKVFLQEFVDARRRAIQNAPQVLFRNDPPLELQGEPGLQAGKGDVGYVTFVLFPRHLAPQRREEVISQIQTFRDYFHYHIKASKVGEVASFRVQLLTARLRHTSTAACDDGRQTSSRCCGERDRRTKMYRRSARRQAAARSGLVHEDS